MRKLASVLSSAALAAAMAVMSFAPANAAPLPAPPIVTDSGVVNVQWGMTDRPRPNYLDGPRVWRRDGHRHGWYGGNYYYNGHRGYRHRRHGYTYYNGWWFPAGAFIAGAIIGSAINNPPPPRYYRGGGSAHVEWCYNRYRSYREWDNTFQPYHGPRQQCYSPYD